MLFEKKYKEKKLNLKSKSAETTHLKIRLRSSAGRLPMCRTCTRNGIINLNINMGSSAVHGNMFLINCTRSKICMQHHFHL